MSALPMDLPLVEIPAAAPRWVPARPALRSVPQRPATVWLARPALQVTPGGRPLGVVTPSRRPSPRAAAAGGLQLTRRGLAVVVVGFAAVMLTAFVVAVVAFLSVSNDPIVSTSVLG